MSSPEGEPFRVTFVVGVTPDKWRRVWERRYPEQPLDLVLVDEASQLTDVRDGTAAMAFVRSPAEVEGLHLIPLYDEVAVVVLPRDHLFAELEQLALADLDQEHRHDPGEWGVRAAVEAVAAGTGVVVLPMSVARAHQRRDVVARPLSDAAPFPVGLAWPRAADGEPDPRVEDFIGVVRGRTDRSSRASTAQGEPTRQVRPGPSPRAGDRARSSARGRRGQQPGRSRRRRG